MKEVTKEEFIKLTEQYENEPLQPTRCNEDDIIYRDSSGKCVAKREDDWNEKRMRYFIEENK
jgi:hypothetical protein